MKQFLLFMFFALTSTVLMAQAELSMSEVDGQYIDGVYRYNKKGDRKPFTGYLYSKHENGKFNSYQNFVDGVGQGTWYNYYENGNVREKGTYKDNKVEGPIAKYYPSGQLESEGTYREWRIRVGLWKYYDASGKLIKTVDHGKKGDFRDVKAYYENGEISEAFYQKQLKS